MWHVLANSICGEMHLSLPSLPIDLLKGRGEEEEEEVVVLQGRERESEGRV